MPDINFDCPDCGQNLDAPQDMAGWEIECPACSNRIRIPDQENKIETGIIETDASAKPPSGDEKGTTVRIDIPTDVNQPAPARRIVKIKRL